MFVSDHVYVQRTTVEHGSLVRVLRRKVLFSLVFCAEISEMVNKLFLTSLLVFFPPGLQMPAGLVCCACHTLVIQLVQPYIRSRDDRMALLAQSEVMLILLAGHVLASTGSFAKGSLLDIGLSIVLIAVSVFVFALLFVHVGLHIKEMYLRKLRELNKKAEDFADGDLDKTNGDGPSLTKLPRIRTVSDASDSDPALAATQAARYQFKSSSRSSSRTDLISSLAAIESADADVNSKRKGSRKSSRAADTEPASGSETNSESPAAETSDAKAPVEVELATVEQPKRKKGKKSAATEETAETTSPAEATETGADDVTFSANPLHRPAAAPDAPAEDTTPA